MGHKLQKLTLLNEDGSVAKDINGNNIDQVITDV